MMSENVFLYFLEKLFEIAILMSFCHRVQLAVIFSERVFGTFLSRTHSGPWNSLHRCIALDVQIHPSWR